MQRTPYHRFNRRLIWDFDGTLAYRHDPDLAWTRLLVETLDEHEPGHEITLDLIRPWVRTGFPWDLPEPNPELYAPGAWWSFVEALLARAYEETGLDPERARLLAAHAHRLYVDHTVGWTIAEGADEVLAELTSLGWSHVILSNHAPELASIVAGLGLSRHFERVLSSAELGVEKPHSGAFAAALAGLDEGAEVWMIGDSYTADVLGAEAVGVPAILVRRTHPDAHRQAPDLRAAAELIKSAF